MEKVRILIVDDDPSIVGMLRKFLAKQGYEPLVAQSGKEALSAVRRAHPAIVLLDVRLPDANGLELLTQHLYPELGDLPSDRDVRVWHAGGRGTGRAVRGA